MRKYRDYTPEQAFLLPPSLTELIPNDDPVFFLRETIQALDFEPFHQVYRCERGRPPYDPALMAGLFLYGAMRGVYSSRRLAELCRRDVACMYLVGGATPDYHTIGEFRQRFTGELKGLFVQVLGLCADAGLVRLGHVSLDGTKLRANASKHKAMSYGRMVAKEAELATEVESWLEAGRREDAEDDAEHGSEDDGWSLPPDMRRKQDRLRRIEEAKERLEERAREGAEAKGQDPDEAEVPQKAQSNFTDPESRIMKSNEGFQQAYNAQAAVDADSQVIVACEVSNAPTDVQRLRPMLDRIQANTGRTPVQFTADAGYASETNFAALAEAGITAAVALRRYHHDEPPDADPGPLRGSGRWPYRSAMRAWLSSPEGKALYRLRKQIGEPVFGQVKGARGFRQFLRRGQSAVEGEWSLVCTAHNLLKLHAATALP